jgi:DNA-binding transcriptional ArsR family regulator
MTASCASKPTLRERPLLSLDQADRAEAVFGILASGTRIRMLHEMVRREEICVVDLAAALSMKPQAVSNQLARLLDQGVVASRRAGNNVLYRVADPCVPILLDRALCLIEEVAKRGVASLELSPVLASEGSSS